MNLYFLSASVLCFLLGISHSALGEYLIFKNKRKKGSLVPSKVIGGLKERHLRILWATWHLATVFGWCLGVLLVKIAVIQNQNNIELTDFTLNSIAYGMFLSSILVLTGTKGKHPGWIVLLVIGVLILIGN